MSEQSIVNYVNSFGRTYRNLRANNDIPDVEIQYLYPGSDRFFIEPEAGLSLSFMSESGDLVQFAITLVSEFPDIEEYKGQLPHPLDHAMTRDGVRRAHGSPLESQGPKKAGPMGMIGGWDSYRLPEMGNLKLTFQYTEDLRVSDIVISPFGRS